MKKLNIDLENCYGIKRLTAKFDFSQHKAYAVYAPNGSMKSSLAQTFKDIADATDSKDRIFPVRVCSRKITDENDVALPKESVLVVPPYDEVFGHTEKTSTLLVDTKLRKEYEQLHIEIDKSKEMFLKALKEQSCSKKDLEKEISSTFTKSDDAFYRALIRVKDELMAQKDAPFADIKYDIIFDEKVLSFLGTKDFKTAIEAYLAEHEEILSKLTNIESFKEEIWKSYFKARIELYDDLIEKYKLVEKRKKEIEEEAGNQRTQWESVIAIFNDRFFVPFKLTAKNRVSVILGEEPMLSLGFTFEDGVDNFDFFRTINSRFVSYLNCLMASKSSAGITLRQATGIKNVFVNDWKLNFFNDPKKKIASIPFIRNIIEYTTGEQDSKFNTLTSLLHWKSDSSGITQDDLDKIYNSVFGASGTSADGKTPVIDIILREASECLKAVDGANFENKIVLSIAIRIVVEQYMAWKINDAAFVSSIDSNQTSKLLEKFKELFSDQIGVIEIIQRVILMTPENIHLNSFMYEPILDMSDDHLRKLYEDVLALK